MNWKRINSLIGLRPLYLYGRSDDWVHKAISKLQKRPIAIIDREVSFKGTTYYGLKVTPFEDLEIAKDSFFIITAGDYEGIVQFLEDNDFHENSHYVISPDFSSYKELTCIRDYSSEILFACSDYNDLKRARSSRKGGGIYKLKTPEGTFSRIYKGSFRQIARYSKGFLTVDYVDKKVVHLSNELEFQNEHKIPFPNSCGIAIDEKNNRVFIANSGKDIIEIYNLNNFKKVNEVQVCSLDGLSKPGQHHLNDLAFFDDTLYYSYFSKTGKWKMGIFDGGLSCIDTKCLESEKRIKINSELISNLSKPHSPFVNNATIRILDSMTGKFIEGNNKIIANFPGFIRGIDQNNEYTMIGMSEDMYVAERMTNESTMLNSGIFILNETLNAYRFYGTQGIMNIHSILIL